ncbi:MAG: hypothetical protein MJZ38_07670, partial [archaeon]|nr:hypothetical protein [archaeon]
LDQPEIVVGDSVFHVCLPATDTRRDPLDRLLGSRDSITRSDIEKEGYSKTEALSMIDSLIRSGRIVRHGGGRSTRYLVQNR